jgi:DNA-binding LacI/PurR family transcriptional regulator
VLIPLSDETRDRLRAAAAELGYRPHPLARALRGAPTMLLGAIVRDITDVFFATATEALST